jgi:hypothetical protein
MRPFHTPEQPFRAECRVDDRRLRRERQLFDAQPGGPDDPEHDWDSKSLAGPDVS